MVFRSSHFFGGPLGKGTYKVMSYLYFYKGKFSTENGLRYILLKEGKIESVRGDFYLYPKNDTHYRSFNVLRDDLLKHKIISVKEYEDFSKWLKVKDNNGELTRLKNYTLYTCKENGGLLEEFETVLEKFIKRHPGVIETEEEVIEDYAKTIPEVQRRTFRLLPTYRQSYFAAKWRNERYQKEKK